MAEKFKREEIISVLTGYQRYFGTRNSRFQTFSKRSPISKKYRMYNVAYSTGAMQERDSIYIGNHVALYYYPRTGTITPKEEKELTNAFVMKYPAKGAKNLEKIVSDVQSNKLVTTGVQNVPSGEEQMGGIDVAKVGGYNILLNRRPGQAQPTDIRGEFRAAGRFKATSGFQVTTQRLDEVGHHGIYGKGGQQLKAEIQGIKQQGGKDAHDRMAKAGLRYFKGRLPQWNAALMKIQNPRIKGRTAGGFTRGSALGVRDTIKGITSATGGGVSIPQLQHFFRGMMAGSTGFFNQSAAQITSTALGNPEFFTERGVSYTYTLDSHAHAVLQNFRMDRSGLGGRIQWDEKSLNHAFAVKGIMATDEYFKLVGAVQRQNDAAVKRGHAQTMHRANKNATSTTIGRNQAANTGELRTNSGRLHASINLHHADKDMGKLIKEGLIPYFREEYAKGMKKFTQQYIGRPERIQGFPTRDLGKTQFRAWAAPYLSITDYSYEAFGT
jgi:hypothetical protein